MRSLPASCTFCRTLLAALLIVGIAPRLVFAQASFYQAKPRVESMGYAYAASDPAPRMMEPAEEIGRPMPRSRYVDPRYQGRAAAMTDYMSRRIASRGGESRLVPRETSAEVIGPGTPADPFVEMPPGSSPPTDSAQPGETYYDGPPSDAPWIDGQPVQGPMVEGAPGEYGEYVEGDYGQYAGDCGGCGRCSQCRSHSRLFPCIMDFCRSPVDHMHSAPVNYGGWGRNITGIGSVQAFKSPVDLGQNGNFGAYYGFNSGFPIYGSIGAQFGALLSFADYQGGTGLVNSKRTQYFVTGGFFRRATCDNGIQAGAVLDYLSDNFYVNMNLLQIRSEVSYLWNKWELGFMGAFHTKSNTAVAPAGFPTANVTWQANDQFNLFYRYHYGFNTTSRMWIGLTGYGDLLLGGDAQAPLNENWAVYIAYNYMVPSNDPTMPKAVKETWGMTIGTIWYPRCKTPNCKFDPLRPLFNVADNSSFFVTTK